MGAQGSKEESKGGEERRRGSATRGSAPMTASQQAFAIYCENRAREASETTDKICAENEKMEPSRKLLSTLRIQLGGTILKEWCLLDGEEVKENGELKLVFHFTRDGDNAVEFPSNQMNLLKSSLSGVVAENHSIEREIIFDGRLDDGKLGFRLKLANTVSVTGTLDTLGGTVERRFSGLKKIYSFSQSSILGTDNGSATFSLETVKISKSAVASALECWESCSHPSAPTHESSAPPTHESSAPPTHESSAPPEHESAGPPRALFRFLMEILQRLFQVVLFFLGYWDAGDEEKEEQLDEPLDKQDDELNGVLDEQDDELDELLDEQDDELDELLVLAKASPDYQLLRKVVAERKKAQHLHQTLKDARDCLSTVNVCNQEGSSLLSWKLSDGKQYNFDGQRLVLFKPADRFVIPLSEVRELRYCLSNAAFSPKDRIDISLISRQLIATSNLVMLCHVEYGSAISAVFGFADETWSRAYANHDEWSQAALSVRDIMQQDSSWPAIPMRLLWIEIETSSIQEHMDVLGIEVTASEHDEGGNN